MAERIDLKGQTFNRLTVIGFSHRDAQGHAYWLCECACGRRVKVESNALRSGKTRSCGCLRRDVTPARVSTTQKRKDTDAKFCEGGYRRSICGDCRNYMCAWLQEHKPVEGWDAVRNDIHFGEKTTESYFVKSCPEYRD